MNKGHILNNKNAMFQGGIMVLEMLRWGVTKIRVGVTALKGGMKSVIEGRKSTVMIFLS